MKKTISVCMCLIFVLTVLCPTGTLIAACFEYRFELFSVSAFAIVIAMLSGCTVVLDLVYKYTLENNGIRVILAAISLLSLINAVFIVFKCPQIWVILSMVFSVICCFYLTIRHGKPLPLKITALVLSALMALPVGLICFILLIFGSIGQTTVVQTVESPSGEYFAQVIDSDQGALGGDTLVDVHNRCGINAILFRIEKEPQRVYHGPWGEFKNMHIYWKDDKILVINSMEYVIE